MVGKKSGGEADTTLPTQKLILFHLEQFPLPSEHSPAPKTQTQEGMAQTLEKAVSNISTWLKPLVQRELLQSGIRRVEGEGRRRRVYWLTAVGRKEVEDLKRTMLEREVEVQTLDGELQLVKIRDVNEVLGLNLSLSSLFNLASAEKKVQRGRLYLEQSRFLPVLASSFVGREEEKKRILNWLASGPGPAQSIVGMPGIGKSALARVIYEDLRGRRPLIWFTVTRWDTPESFLRIVATLLSAQGLPALEAKLKSFGQSGEGHQHSEFMEIIVRDFISEPRPVVILDNLHLTPEPLKAFLMDLIQWCDSQRGPRWLLLARSSESMKDLMGRVTLQTIQIAGLEPHQVQQLMPHSPPELVAQLHAATNGHPLAVKLIGPSDAGGEELEQFIQTQIMAQLEPGERKLVEMSAIQPVPSSAESLQAGSKLGGEHVTALREKGLLVSHEDGSLSLHGLLQPFVFAELAEATRRELHRLQYRHFRKYEDDDSLLRQIYHLEEFGETRRALELVERWGHQLVDRGRSELFHLIEPLIGGGADGRQAAAHLLQGRILLLWGRFEEAQEALDIAGNGPLKKLGPNLRSQIIALKVEIAREKGDEGSIIQLQKDLLKYEVRGNETWAAGEAHNELGLSAKTKGEMEQARHHYMESLRIFDAHEARGDAPRRSPSAIKPLANLALLHHEMGESRSAVQNLTRAIKRSQVRRDEISGARCLLYLAQITRNNDQLVAEEGLPSPLDCLEQAALLFQRVGDRRGMASVFIEKCKVLLDADMRKDAAEALGSARIEAEKVGEESLLRKIQNMEQHFT